MSWRIRDFLWPGLLAGSVMAVLAVVVFRMPASPSRTAVVLWFFVVCPGMAWARALRIPDTATRWAFAIGASIGVEVLLTLALGYAGLRAPRVLAAVVATATIAGVVVEVARPGWEERNVDVQ
jgi:hypothetical protein